MNSGVVLVEKDHYQLLLFLTIHSHMEVSVCLPASLSLAKRGPLLRDFRETRVPKHPFTWRRDRAKFFLHMKRIIKVFDISPMAHSKNHIRLV